MPKKALINRNPLPPRVSTRVLDTFDSALNCHILYFYLVSNYLNPLAIAKPIWYDSLIYLTKEPSLTPLLFDCRLRSVIIHVAITSISDFLIRISKGNLIVTTWIMAVSTLDLICGLVITAKAFVKNSLTPACDVLTEINTGLAFPPMLNWANFRTDNLVNTLMTYTVYTGLIVGIDAALGMILYTVMPNNFIFLGEES
ncbi:hypothetical protein C0995_014457 [Termitomyces sp. Mi166|nr:hypothetical protein C0995_014457 [Termitomyces sp. Mi166\